MQMPNCHDGSAVAACKDNHKLAVRPVDANLEATTTATDQLFI